MEDNKKKSYTGGLVLSRKVGEAIYLKVKDLENKEIRIDVRDLKNGMVRIGVMADAELIEIFRSELFEKDKH